MRDMFLRDSWRFHPVPAAVWGVTCILGLAILANAFFGQPDTGRMLAASSGGDASQADGGSARLEVDAPGGGQTIQLKYDPLVETVQRELSSAGFYRGTVDGVIGRKTRQAIAEYQASVGLEPDGKATQDLIEHIRFTRAVSDASLFTGSIKPDPDAEARAAIRRVQTGLAELAYSPGEINGELTHQTRKAILAFQHDRQMPETGEITDGLLAELGKMSGQSELATE
jgi:peptidoglycan hydrolase-like protein with peptidoglycan-binding domain